jgi:hypothetical protein
LRKLIGTTALPLETSYLEFQFQIEFLKSKLVTFEKIARRGIEKVATSFSSNPGGGCDKAASEKLKQTVVNLPANMK